MAGSWLLTPQAHALLAIARGHAVRVRDIATELDVTERTAQQLVNELVEAGCLTRHRLGTRNFYEVHRDAASGDPLDGELTVGALVRAACGGKPLAQTAPLPVARVRRRGHRPGSSR